MSSYYVNFLNNSIVKEHGSRTAVIVIKKLKGIHVIAQCSGSLDEQDVLIQMNICKQLKTTLSHKLYILLCRISISACIMYLLSSVSYYNDVHFAIGHWRDVQYVKPIRNSVPRFSELNLLSHSKDLFSHKEHLGVVLNTDGVALFKS